MNESIFKSYDVRGIYGTDLKDEDAYKIGRAFARFLDAKAIAVGRDCRVSTPALFEKLTQGIRENGTKVIDLGLVMTPMTYYASGILPVDGAIMLTASHNPGEYNGFKFCRANAVPIGKSSGLTDIKNLALEEMPAPAETLGKIETYNIAAEFHQATKKYATFGDTPYTVVIDTANAMGAADLPLWRSFPNITLTTLFEDLDGSFPNHEANPMHLETLESLIEKVHETKAHLGISYDGDADRIGFVDETGVPVPGDMIIALLAQDLLPKNPGRTVAYDVRSSKAVKEIIEENGGVALEAPVGHSNIKKLMRETNALFAGETSQHYYFADFSFAENGTVVGLMLLNRMNETGKTLSQLVDQVRRYSHSGEINFKIADTQKALASLKEKYADGELNQIDGIKIVYPEWWFSVRASNTEPVVRLNLEANTQEMMQQKKAKIKQILESN